MIRAEAGMPTSRFCDLLGIPRPTWYRWKAAVQGSRPGKGPWPAPVVDDLEPVAAKYAEQWPAWGHRKVWGLLRADGVAVSQSSVRRAMARRGLLQPVGYQAERRQLARARRAVFEAPPSRRCRVWQVDFSELETAAGGIWRLGGVVDYVAKTALACTVTATQTTADAIAKIEAARAQAEAWLGHPLAQECVDLATGELIAPVVLVTDNGPCYRSVGFARWIAAQPEFTHVRTRHRSPQTNGVIERFFQALKYEHLYRRELDDGVELAREVDAYRAVYNTVRPHEALGFVTPAHAWHARSWPANAHKNQGQSVSDS